MILYMRCYVPGCGYTTRRVRLPAGVPETAAPDALTDQKRRVFLRTGAQLFLGTLDGSRFGCVRNIETSLRDESGRACMANIAFEAEKSEAPLVDSLLWLAFEDYAVFVRAVQDMIVYTEDDYLLDPEALERFLNLAPPRRHTDRAAVSLLVPEITVQYFLSNTGLPLREKDIRRIGHMEKIKGA